VATELDENVTNTAKAQNAIFADRDTKLLTLNILSEMVYCMVYSINLEN
jgi:hypothetical protein